MRRAVSVALATCAVVALAAAGRATARPSCGTVEVVDPGGHPIAGVEVSHYASDPRGTPRHGSAPEAFTTDAAGRACAEDFLEPGFLELQAPGRLGGWCAADEVEPYRGWRASAPVTRLTLAIKPLRRSRWQGRVVAADGRPVARASILISRIYPDGTECSESGPDGWRLAGADGRFALPPLPHGKIELIVDADGYARKVFFVALPADPYDLAIEHGARWTGHVLDPDGAPIPNCSIDLRTRDEIDVTAGCGGAAGFDIRHIPPGNLIVKVRIGDHPTLAGRPFRQEVQIAPDERRQEDLHFPSGLTLAGRVVTEAGEPAAHETVAAISADRDRTYWEGRLEVETDDDGRFVFHHVAAGEWSLVAGAFGPKPERQTVNAGAQDLTLVIGGRRRR